MISVARLSLCTTCVVNKVFFCDLPHWQPHHNQPAKRKNTNIGNVNNTDCGSWLFAFEWNSHIEWYRDRGNPALQNTMQLSVERPQSELWIIIIITDLVGFHYGQRRVRLLMPNYIKGWLVFIIDWLSWATDLMSSKWKVCLKTSLPLSLKIPFSRDPTML